MISSHELNAPHRSRPLAQRSKTAVRACLLVATTALVGAAGAAEVGTSVGQVSLLIGAARVVHKSGVSEPLQRGSAILVGDRVETGVNGHVHVRFIDSGSVSVRPESVLEVQAYRFDANEPKSSEVRLQLDHGASRSISGRATEVDKNRFRLNTPLAAIGVRGTDFIVQATQAGLRATVAEGAIVVGALGDSCPAASLGPCGGAQARVLSADMGRWMVELLRGEQVARVVPVSVALLAGGMPGAEDRVATQRAAESAARSAGILAAEPYRQNDRAAAELLTLAATGVPVPDLNVAPDPNARLAWGRYTFAPGFNDNITAPFAVAQAGRHVTVGSAEATLFRAGDPTQAEGLLAATDAVVEFRLTRGQATFEAGGQREAASIGNGKLVLDFGHRTFVTALPLSSVSGGSTELRVAGDVRMDGTFAVRDLDTRQYVAGAVSLDGKEAGYLFERGVPGGLFRGKTLWGR